MKLSPSEVLRGHARERWLRGAIRSVNMDGAPVLERLSEAAWVDSCQLCAGVGWQLLDVLGLIECHGGQELEDARALEKWTARITMAQAAKILGVKRTHVELKAMRFAALRMVTERMLARRERQVA